LHGDDFFYALPQSQQLLVNKRGLIYNKYQLLVFIQQVLSVLRTTGAQFTSHPRFEAENRWLLSG